MTQSIRRVAVIGAGTMGHGIAYVALVAGYAVALADADRDALLAALDRIAESFAGAIERGKLADADRARLEEWAEATKRRQPNEE